MKNYIVGLGEVLFDCLPEGKKLGGAPANFAYHVGRFGLDSIAVSAIGKDENGLEIQRILNEVGLEVNLSQVDYPTGTVQVSLSGNGIPQYDICQGVAYDNIPWTEELEQIAKNARGVCFGSLAQRNAVSRASIQKFLDAMSPIGTLKVFDINLRQHWYSKEIIEESLSRCNVLKLNDEELPVVAEMIGLKPIDSTGKALQLVNVEDQCYEIMRQFELQMIILTCGVNGSYVFCSDGRVSFQNTHKVSVVDTVGAGDSFTGSFVACLLKGKSMEEAHKRAVEISAYVCTCPGAMPQVPSELVEL